MNELQIKPFDWVKQIPSSLIELDEKPLFGNGPAFPWDAFSTALAKLFDQKELKISPGEMKWREKGELLKGLGSEVSLSHVTIPGLEGTLAWVLSKNEIDSLMQALLSIPVEPFMALDKEFEEGFYRFTLAQALQTIKQLDFDKNLSPALTEENSEFDQELSYCIDIAITVKQQIFQGRLIIPQQFRVSWKERYADRKLGTFFSSALAKKTGIIVHLEAGRTSLQQTELAHVAPGDYIILDHCTYEPDSDKGRVMMTVNGVPLFRAKLKQGSLKILEFPLYHEAQESMNNKEDDEDFEEHTEESELEELTEDEISEEDEDLSEISELEAEEQAPAPPVKPTSAPPQPAKEGKVSVQDLPVNIVIEVGRLQISVQKLMELVPGNILEVDISPENGVDLVVNGKRIGKGELIRIGETLGVRVLDLG